MSNPSRKPDLTAFHVVRCNHTGFVWQVGSQDAVEAAARYLLDRGTTWSGSAQTDDVLVLYRYQQKADDYWDAYLHDIVAVDQDSTISPGLSIQLSYVLVAAYTTAAGVKAYLRAQGGRGWG